MTTQKLNSIIPEPEYSDSKSHYNPGVRISKSDIPTEESIAFAHRCRELFEYQEGVLVRKVRRGRYQVGDLAGSLGTDGYYRLTVEGIGYQLHQIIYLIHHNYIPSTIDHIDRNTKNNCIENLRKATSRENLLNKYNNSQTPNITKQPNGKFRIQIHIEGKRREFGRYNTLEEAKDYLTRINNDFSNWRSYLISRNNTTRTLESPLRYISKHTSGFQVRKHINGARKHFGTYKTLEEAIEVRDKLESNNWEA